MSLDRRLKRLEEQHATEQATASAVPQFWGAPRTEEERQARLDAGLTPANAPGCFWEGETQTPNKHRPRKG